MYKKQLNKKIASLKKQHAKDIINALLEAQVNFSILSSTKQASFTPSLPSHIYDGLQGISLFVLAGYTFKSAVTYDSYMEFEAGFGKENIGSVVSIPFSSIMQIIINANTDEKSPNQDIVLFINPLAFNIEAISYDNEESFEKDLLESSKEAILSNDANKNLKKQRK